MKPGASNIEKSEVVQQDYEDHIQCASVSEIYHITKKIKQQHLKA